MEKQTYGWKVGNDGNLHCAYFDLTEAFCGEHVTSRKQHIFSILFGAKKYKCTKCKEFEEYLIEQGIK